MATIAIIIALLIALTIHEAAHAFMANYLGDPTAKLMGRLTLNPLAHLDPFGTLVFILTAFAGFPFGWGKPVIYDPYNLANPKRDAALISLAGPVSNLILASILSLILRFFFNPIWEPFIIINLSLAIFNLIPIHPLDGGKILVALLPARQGKQYDLFLKKYGIIILVALILPIWNGSAIISMVMNPILGFLLPIFIPQSFMI